MMHQHVKKMKMYFTGVLTFLAVLLILGIFAVRADRVFGVQTLTNALDYLQYKMEVDYEGNGYRMLANVLSIFRPSISETKAADAYAQAIPVLLYHGIVEEADRFNITPQNFKEHLFALKKDGYETIGIEDFSKFIKGETKLPKKSFLLTFDDGRRDSYYEADPILKALDFKAVMFVATGPSLPQEYRKEGYYLSQRELERMHDSGRWEIQSHGIQETGGFITIDMEGAKGNFLSNKMWIDSEKRLETDEEFASRVRNEIVDSKKRIEETLHTPALAFSFPFSDYGQQQINNPEAKMVVQKIAMETYPVLLRQTTLADGDFIFNYTKEQNTFAKRLEPHPSWSAEYLLEILHTAEPKDFPFEDTFETNKGWKGVWGQYTNTPYLFTSATPSTNGSFVLLDGTRAWSNYQFNVELKKQTGSHISLIGRYQDEKNYLSCVYNSSSVRIEQYINAVRTIVAESKVQTGVGESNSLELQLRVQDDAISCGLQNRKIVFAYNIPLSLLSGGIGIKTWSENANIASVEVAKVQVTSIEADEPITLISPPRATQSIFPILLFTPSPPITTREENNMDTHEVLGNTNKDEPTNIGGKEEESEDTPKKVKKTTSKRFNFTQLQKSLGTFGGSNAIRAMYRQKGE